MTDDIVVNMNFNLGKDQTVADIVARLRQEWEYGNNAKGCDYEMFAQAADEIERLREQNEYLKANVEMLLAEAKAVRGG